MNCLIFYEAMAKQEYLNNPIRAEQLYMYAKNNLIREALQGVSIKGLSTEEFATIICSYWVKMGLCFKEQHSNLFLWSSTSFLNDNLRTEFDEEYIELHWRG